MHNALSNSVMRALLMLLTQNNLDCRGWKIVTKENKNGKRLIHKFPPVLLFPRLSQSSDEEVL